MLKNKASNVKKNVRREIKYFYPLLITVILVAITVSLIVIKSGDTIKDVYMFFSTLKVEEIRSLVASFGIKAPIVFILLQISQAVIAPIPGFIFTIAGGLIFGALFGTILSILGSMIGAFLCFLLSKKYGRPFVEKMLKKEDFGAIDDLFQEKGVLMTAFLRAIPVMSFGLASYLVSITNIDIKDYMIGTFIGLIPTTIFYTYLGFYILKSPIISMVVGLLLLIFFLAMPFMIPIVRRYIKKKKGKKKKITS